ncbi:MAG: efflux RND transporter periplasmic adaptor subunit [Proteobacteria bacterium]|nr:efflux RND transporter periplasmic adaptor subunit [Pseudomonadota bacterium]
MTKFRSTFLGAVALVLAVVLLAVSGAGNVAWRYVTDAMASVGSSSRPATDTARSGGHGGGAIAVAVAPAQKGTFPVVVSAFGNVQSPAVVEVGARISSQITAIHVKDGQMVKAGDILFSLDDRALRAQLARDQAILAKDNALLVSATADMNRAKDLASKQAGTQQAYDEALAAQQAAQATVAGDQATVDADQVQLSYTSITAPISGRLGAVQVALGDIVGGSASAPSAANALVSITQVDPIEVVFHLPEANLSTFKKLLDAGEAPTVRALRSASTDVLATGVMDFIDSAVDMTSGTIAMRAAFANEQMALWPGQYVDVEIDQGQLNDTTLIPTVALQPGQNGQFVYLVRPDNTIEARPVQVAASEGNLSAIVSGLAAGDQVVTEGQLRLKPGIKVQPTVAEASGTSASPVQPASFTSPQKPARKIAQ